MEHRPVVIIGAGPQGLAAAAHLRERGLMPLVLERGDRVGAAVREWAHVRLFSSWPELVDSASGRLLRSLGHDLPSAGYPKAAAWLKHYIEPLGAALGDSIRTGVEVTSVTRLGRDLVVSQGRAEQPFVVHITDADGHEERLLARAVIDASGTWATPGPLGGDGARALGEWKAAAAGLVSYRIPDDVSHLAGEHIAVVGAGHSATHAVLRLADLARRAPGTRVTWLLRRATAAQVFGTGEADALPQRASLGARAKRAIDEGFVELVAGFRVHGVESRAGQAVLVADDGREAGPIAHVYALTGFRPNRAILSELRVQLDPVLEAVAGIADEIDPNIHSCGTVAATGASQLQMAEQDLFIVGAKSYGRAPTFLALTGYEQVRSVVAHLAGDHAAAARNELVIPETGACGGAAAFDGGASSCCAPAPTRAATLELVRP